MSGDFFTIVQDNTVLEFFRSYTPRCRFRHRNYLIYGSPSQGFSRTTDT